MKEEKKFCLIIKKILPPEKTKGIKGKIMKFLHLGKPVVVLTLKDKKKGNTYYMQEGDSIEFTLTINYEIEKIELT